MSKPLVLALAALAVAGCADDEVPTPDPVQREQDLPDDSAEDDGLDDGAVLGGGVPLPSDSDAVDRDAPDDGP